MSLCFSFPTFSHVLPPLFLFCLLFNHQHNSFSTGAIRLIAATAGCFSVWVALTAGGNENPCSLAGWATAMTATATHGSTQRGVASRLGLSPDFAYFAAVFVTAQAIVLFWVHNGAGATDDVTTTRPVATAVGSGTAIAMATIPFCSLFGGNPTHAKDVLRYEIESLVKCLKLLLLKGSTFSNDNDHDLSASGNNGTSAAAIADQMKESEHAASSKMIELVNGAKTFEKDAGQVPVFPICRVDPNLKSKLESLATCGAFAQMLMEFARCIVSDKESASLF